MGSGRLENARFMHASRHRLHNKVHTHHEMCAETSMLLLMTGRVADASGSKLLASKQRFLKIT